ncbi:hypothetical protein MNBD_GAMMA11-706 [hydrothermal vent metagenome]|uniref:Uncharacterized protein n=1 Tax=hydrothermal vent metagenome TaxID=652676 RepID=A0A3B0X1A8_9ZZZZ
MTKKHYIEIPILLSEEQVSDLVALDTLPITSAPAAPLQTLGDLNSQIISQLATYSVQHRTDNILPLSITVTALLPLTRGLR